MDQRDLEAEVIRLTDLLTKEREKNAAFEQTIAAMQQQETAMAALFRGTQPTHEGRSAHARVTSGRD